MLSFSLESAIIIIKTKKGGGAEVKMGDRFKDRTTGKIYVVTMVIYNKTVILEGEDGLGRRITDTSNLERTCEKLEDGKS